MLVVRIFLLLQKTGGRPSQGRSKSLVLARELLSVRHAHRQTQLTLANWKLKTKKMINETFEKLENPHYCTILERAMFRFTIMQQHNSNTRLTSSKAPAHHLVGPNRDDATASAQRTNFSVLDRYLAYESWSDNQQQQCGQVSASRCKANIQG